MFLELVEFKAKTASVLPFFIGLVFSWYNYQSVHIGYVFIYFVAMFIFNMAVDMLDNYNDYDLVGDTYDMALSSGFKLVDVLPMKNITRCSGHKEWNKGDICWHDNDEKIMVFQKDK